jgi:hypothetical protein
VPIIKSAGVHFVSELKKGEFYRAVVKEIAKRAASGEKITYDDWPE